MKSAIESWPSGYGDADHMTLYPEDSPSEAGDTGDATGLRQYIRRQIEAELAAWRECLKTNGMGGATQSFDMERQTRSQSRRSNCSPAGIFRLIRDELCRLWRKWEAVNWQPEPAATLEIPPSMMEVVDLSVPPLAINKSHMPKTTDLEDTVDIQQPRRPYIVTKSLDIFSHQLYDTTPPHRSRSALSDTASTFSPTELQDRETVLSLDPFAADAARNYDAWRRGRAERVIMNRLAALRKLTGEDAEPGGRQEGENEGDEAMIARAMDQTWMTSSGRTRLGGGERFDRDVGRGSGGWVGGELSMSIKEPQRAHILGD